MRVRRESARPVAPSAARRRRARRAHRRRAIRPRGREACSLPERPRPAPRGARRRLRPLAGASPGRPSVGSGGRRRLGRRAHAGWVASSVADRDPQPAETAGPQAGQAGLRTQSPGIPARSSASSARARTGARRLEEDQRQRVLPAPTESASREPANRQVTASSGSGGPGSGSKVTARSSTAPRDEHLEDEVPLHPDLELDPRPRPAEPGERVGSQRSATSCGRPEPNRPRPPPRCSTFEQLVVERASSGRMASTRSPLGVELGGRRRLPEQGAAALCLSRFAAG
jgi:hypothetical protein